MFQRKVDEGSKVPGYSIGLAKSVLIIGLGNPGEKHAGSRHNIGFVVLDLFAKQNQFPDWHNKKDLKCQLSVHALGQSRVILCKPTTYMNHSGEAVSAVQRFYQIYNNGTLAVYDELALGFGQIRARSGGSDAGHNGVKSLMAHLGDDFGRLRIGIGNEVSSRADSANFVLGKFNSSELKQLDTVSSEASAMISEYIISGELPHETRNIL